MSRTNHPWFRILAEGGVIVLSILLAFSVDAAWEARLEAELEDQVLSSIARDMQSNRTALGMFILDAEAAAGRFESFLERSGAELSSMPEDSAAVYLVTLFTASTYQPTYGSVSDSNLSLLNDLDLRNELSTWLAVLEDLQETAPYEIDSSFELMALAGGAGALLPVAPLLGIDTEGPSLQVALARLRNDEGFVNAALRGLTIRSIALQKLIRLRDSTDRVASLVPQ